MINSLTNMGVVIGIEVHAQLNTKIKLFSPMLIKHVKKQNTYSNDIDRGMPGTLPVINKNAIKLAIIFGKIINGKINNYITFDRKHYFYPDLPKGYQITQQNNPIIKNGFINIKTNENFKKKIKIKKANLEEDTGKILHNTQDMYSYIDYNRSGIPLLEIVTEPIITSSTEAINYLKKLHKILKTNKICKGRLELGEFRCDINISMKEKSSNKLNKRVEIKNINSFKFIKNAIEYEIKRQTNIYNENKTIKQETRCYDKHTNTTKLLRKKEFNNDYAYCTEPNIPPIYINEKLIKKIYQQHKKEIYIFSKKLLKKCNIKKK